MKTTTDPYSKTTELTYNQLGKVATSKDKLGRVTSFLYDQRGNLIQTVYPADGNTSLTVTRTVYDANNRPIYRQDPHIPINPYGPTTITPDAQVTKANGTHTVYDALGRIAQTERWKDMEIRLTLMGEGIDAYGTTEILPPPDPGPTEAYFNQILSRTTTEYDAAGRVVATTDARLFTTRFEYDEAGRRTAIIDPKGEKTRFGYDANGNQVLTTDALGRQTAREYDELNRRTKTILPVLPGQTVPLTLTTAYDAMGRVSAETDQASVVTAFGYDGAGRLLAVTNDYHASPAANPCVTRYEYDDLGNLTKQVDAHNRQTLFEYDKLNRRNKRILPNSAFETWEYDSAGNLLRHTDFKGQIMEFTYDALNRLHEKSQRISGTLSSLAVFSYSPTGRRLSVAQPNWPGKATGMTSYEYDKADRLTKKAIPIGWLIYEYDKAGNLTRIKSSDTTASVTWIDTWYAWDPLNRLQAMTNAMTTPPLVTSYLYDAVGNLTNSTYPNSIQTAYGYDVLNRLTNVFINPVNGGISSEVASFNYNPDARPLAATGQRKALYEKIATPSGTIQRQIQYEYNPLRALITEEVVSTTPHPKVDYTYDWVGNRLTRNSTMSGVPSATRAYDINDRLDNNSTPTDANPNYDANGNTLIETLPSSSPTSADSYDGENRLIKRTVGTKQVQLFYDADGNRIAKNIANDTIYYVVDDRNPSGYAQVLLEIARVESSSYETPSRRYSYGHDLVSQQLLDGSTEPPCFYYGYDGLGSVRFLMDQNGGVTDTYTYDAFGILISSSATTPNNYFYAGEQWDSDLGLYYNRARYLNPNTGRFWTMDTYEGSQSDPLSLHKYLYAHADPVNNTDPTGMFTLSEINIVGAIQSTLQTIRAQGPRVALKAARTPIYNVYYGFAPIPPFGHSGIFVGSKVPPHTGWMFHVLPNTPGPKFGTRSGVIEKDGPRPLRAFTTTFPFPNFKFTEFSQLEFMFWQAELKVINATEDFTDTPVQYSQLGFIGQPFSCHSWAAKAMLSAVATSRRVVLK